MDGFTISNANRFLETGKFPGVGDSKTSTLGISSGSGIGAGGGPGSLGETQSSFADTLKTAIGNVNELQKTSDTAIQNLATGRTDNVADVMIAAEKSDIALKLMVQVRNKIIDAYQEVMKMQV